MNKDLDQLVRDILQVPYSKSKARELIQAYTTKARIDTAEHLHRNQGEDLPKRDFDTDTDEYICTTYIPRLEATLEDKEG